MLLVGAMTCHPVGARYIPWGKIWKKGMEILVTGGLVAGIDAGIDAANKPAHMQPYTPAYPEPRPNHPAHLVPNHDHDHDTGFILAIIGGSMMVMSVMGIVITYIIKTCKKMSTTSAPRDNMEMA